MNKLIALVAAAVIAAMPIVANAGAPSTCPDFNGDGRVTMNDVLVVVNQYQGPKNGGGVYSMVDLITALRHYGETCA